MNTTIKNILKFLLFLGFGIGLLYLVYQSQNKAYQAQCALDGLAAADCSLMEKVITDFRSVKISWLLGAFIAYIISNVSRALRWQMLLKSFGGTTRFVNAFLTTMLGYFANLGLPRLGEVLRPVYMAKYEKIPVEKILGTIVVDRTIDVFSLLSIIGLAFFLEFDTLWGYLSDTMGDGTLMGVLQNPIILVLLSVGTIGAISLFIFREKIQTTTIYKKVEQLFLGFWEGILSIKNLEKPGLFIIYSISIWLGYFVMYYCYMPAFEPTAHLGLRIALMSFVFGSLGIVIPSPGGMGTYHFLVGACFVLYGINAGDAFSAANISFFSTHFCNIVLGLIAVLFLPILNKNYIPTREKVQKKMEVVDVASV